MVETYSIAATFALALLVGVLLVVLFGAGASLGQVEEKAQERPNFVFVLTYPLCYPGRVTIQRGQYPHNTRIYGNSEPLGGWERFRRLDLHESTIATWLDKEGYETGLFGKYMNTYRDGVIPPGWDRWYAWNGEDEGWSSVNDQGDVGDLNRQDADLLVADNAAAFLEQPLESPEPVFAFVNFGAMHEPSLSSSVDADKFRGGRGPAHPGLRRGRHIGQEADIRRNERLTGREISDLDSQYREGLRSLRESTGLSATPRISSAGAARSTTPTTSSSTWTTPPTSASIA